MIDEAGFGKRLDEIMQKANYSNSQLTRELNVSKNAIGNYKNNQIPNAVILLKMSQLLGTTMEYLLTGKDVNDLTPEEQELVEAYRMANPAMRYGARKMLDIPEPEPEQEESSTFRTG